MQSATSLDLRIPTFSFDSPLANVVLELEYLRTLKFSGTTPSSIFFQIKDIFHYLESLGSARIEGNRTTLADYIEAKLNPQQSPQDAIHEIENIEKALNYIEQNVKYKSLITHEFICKLHEITVNDLKREGDQTPGIYRTVPVSINHSSHKPPNPAVVALLMDELADFINKPEHQKYDLLKIAIAHHRFTWIHPFRNGNGRVVRLLTYALMIKYGFNVHKIGRLLNPTAVFCNDRDRYYDMLSRADQGTDESLGDWCHYVLSGILTEFRKVEKLADYSYVQKSILLPAITLTRERGKINDEEAKILAAAAGVEVFQASDIKKALPDMDTPQRSYRIKKLRTTGLLRPLKPNSRSYALNLASGPLLPGVVQALHKEAFVPINNED